MPKQQMSILGSFLEVRVQEFENRPQQPLHQWVPLPEPGTNKFSQYLYNMKKKNIHIYCFPFKYYLKGKQYIFFNIIMILFVSSFKIARAYSV